MIEELNLLMQTIAKLPDVAIWVLVGVFIYKVSIIGSIYGVIRLAINKMHDWLVCPERKTIEMRPTIDGMCISGTSDQLIAQLQRVRGAATQSTYIHLRDIDFLREALDDAFEKKAVKK